MVLIQVQNNRIQVKLNRCVNFQQVVDTCKRFRCIYDPEERVWVAPHDRIENLEEFLSDFDTVEFSQKTKDDITALRNKSSEIKAISTPVTKADLKVQPVKGKPPYEDYQWDDLKRAVSTNRLGFGHQQGLGKSWMIANTCDVLDRFHGVKKVLYVTSNSGVLSMKKEFKKFTYIPEDQIIIGGTMNRRPFDDLNARVIIMNYRSFLLVSDEYYKDTKGSSKSYRKCPIPISQWLGGDKGIVVLDESHNITNPKARQTQTLRLAIPFFEFRYLASGTPADKTEKWYSQLNFLDSGLVGNQNYSSWLAQNAYLGNNHSQWAINGFRPECVKIISDLASKHWIRRFSDETLELPEHIKKRIYVEMNPHHRQVYEAVVKAEVKLNLQLGDMSGRAIFNSFPHIMSAIDNPEIILNNVEQLREKLKNDSAENIIKLARQYKYAKHNAKIESTIDLIEEHPDSKVVIWVAHPSTAEHLMESLAKYNPISITGQTKKDKGEMTDQLKERIVSLFRTDKDCRVLIASIQSLNSAITIVEANVQIYFDSTFDFIIFDQSLKRIHRIGQEKHVYTYFLVYDKSLNVLQYKNLEDKNYMNDNFMNLKNMSLQDLQTIFNMEGE